MKIFNLTWKWKEFLSTLKEIELLIIGGLIVFPLVTIIGIIYSFVKHLFSKRDYSLSKQLNPVIRSITLASDGLACAAGGEMLNDVLKVKGKIKYGKWYNTISAITGLRFKYENFDNKFRRILDKTLGENHCIEAITEEENFYYSNNINK